MPTEFLNELVDLLQALWATPNRWLRRLIIVAVTTPFISMIMGMIWGPLAMLTALIPIMIVIGWATIRVDPLVVGILNQYDFGKKLTGWIVFIAGLELAWAFFCGVFPLENDLRVSFTALFALLAAASLAGGSAYLKLEFGWPKKLAKLLVFSAFICGVILLLGGRKDAEKNVLGVGSWVLKTVAPTVENPTSASMAEFPKPASTCEGAGNLFFNPAEGRVKIETQLAKECWTGWVNTPPDWKDWEFQWTGSGGIWIQFLNEEPMWLPSKSSIPFGTKRGVFRAAGNGQLFASLT